MRLLVKAAKRGETGDLYDEDVRIRESIQAVEAAPDVYAAAPEMLDTLQRIAYRGATMSAGSVWAQPIAQLVQDVLARIEGPQAIEGED
jgi:hypothetical protein